MIVSFDAVTAVPSLDEVLDRLPFGACVLGADGVVLAWNAALADGTGIARENAVGTPLGSHYPDLLAPGPAPPDDRESALKERLACALRIRMSLLHQIDELTRANDALRRASRDRPL